MKIIRVFNIIVASLFIITAQQNMFASHRPAEIVAERNAILAEKQDAATIKNLLIIKTAIDAIEDARGKLLTKGTTETDDKKNVATLIKQVFMLVQAEQQLEKINLVVEDKDVVVTPVAEDGYWSRFVAGAKKLGTGILAPFKSTPNNPQDQEGSAHKIISALGEQQDKITKMYAERIGKKAVITPEQKQLQKRYEAIMTDINAVIQKQQAMVSPGMSSGKKLLIGAGVATAVAAGLAVAKMYLDVDPELQDQPTQTFIPESNITEPNDNLEIVSEQISAPRAVEAVEAVINQPVDTEFSSTENLDVVGTRNEDNDTSFIEAEETETPSFTSNLADTDIVDEVTDIVEPTELEVAPLEDIVTEQIEENDLLPVVESDVLDIVEPEEVTQEIIEDVSLPEIVEQPETELVVLEDELVDLPSEVMDVVETPAVLDMVEPEEVTQEIVEDVNLPDVTNVVEQPETELAGLEDELIDLPSEVIDVVEAPAELDIVEPEKVTQEMVEDVSLPEVANVVEQPVQDLIKEDVVAPVVDKTQEIIAKRDALEEANIQAFIKQEDALRNIKESADNITQQEQDKLVAQYDEASKLYQKTNAKLEKFEKKNRNIFGR